MVTNSHLARLVGALIGAAAGALLALVVACALFPIHTTTIEPTKLGALDWAAHAWGHRDFHEDREKALYVLTLVFGGAFATLGAWLRPAGDRATWVSGLLLAGFVPVMNEIIYFSMDGDAFAAAWYCNLGIHVLVGIAVLSRFLPNIANIFSYPEPQHRSTASQPSSPLEKSWDLGDVVLGGTLAVALIAAFIIPTHPAEVARSIGYEMHMGLYMIGPATYEFAKGLVPGIDYYTQYSIGTPWLFSHFLASTSKQTLVDAVWFEVAEIAFFEVSLFFFLWWLLRSWAWAMALTIAILLTQFTTPDPLYAPSSTASRYPLMAVVAGCFVLWVRRHLVLAMALPLALALAGSLFLNTETGVYACAAVAIAAVAAAPNLARSIRQVVLLGILTFVAFMLLSAAAFGPRVFTVEFLEYLVEPMLLYASGLGSVAMDWAKGWPWLYNIVSPGLALASVGWVAVVARQPDPAAPRERLAALAWLSLIALFMSGKYINMSLVALWQVNAWAFLVVLAWWTQTLIGVVVDRTVIVWPLVLNLRAILAGGAAAILVLLVIGFGDRRSPNGVFAVAAYRTFPSVVNRVFGVATLQGCAIFPREGCRAHAVSYKDVELIRNLTKAGTRVAVYDILDWVYLVEAQRASKFAELPSVMMFTQRQLDQSLRDIDLIFLPRNPSQTFGIDNRDVANILVPQLQKDFKKIAEGTDLLAWQRSR